MTDTAIPPISSTARYRTRETDEKLTSSVIPPHDQLAGERGEQNAPVRQPVQ
jgi:hypothetical protein